ncbi:MAG: hypothetical protein FJ087_17155 [Deltaproteobacteria bacterium]|nr:hypothetical protein [Deltaproteobacteria bacterium]
MTAEANVARPDPALVAGCTHQLEIGESGRALKCFEAALPQWPDDADLLFGAALSGLVYASELSVMITSAPAQFADPGDGYAETLPEGMSQNEYLAAEIHRIFMRLREHFVTAAGRLDRVAGRGVRFEVTACPIFLGLKPTLQARGVFDDGDVLLMGAIADAIIGVFDFLAGQDWDTEVLDLVNFVKDGLGDVDFQAIAGVLTHLLNSDERFLTLHPVDGATLFEDARVRFGAAGAKLEAAIARIRELGDGGKDVTWVEDVGATARLKFASVIRYADDGTTAEEVLSFELTQKVMAGFRNASESILTPGRRTTLHGGVFPVLAAMAVTASRSGMLSGMNLKLPIDIGAFEIGALSDLLGGLVPNVLAFDWGTFFGKPAGLRPWLPEWTDGAGPLKDRFLTEWECPDDLDADGYPSGALGLLCGDGATLSDAAHFAGESFATEPDGIASALPVFAFGDPTLGGLLYVDLAGEPGSDEAGAYLPADATTLNAALGRLVSGILPLLPK